MIKILLVILWMLIYLPIIVKPHKIEPFILGFPYNLFWLLLFTLILLILVVLYALTWNPEGKK